VTEEDVVNADEKIKQLYETAFPEGKLFRVIYNGLLAHAGNKGY